MLKNIYFKFSVDVFCDVINGPFVVSAKGGNGHRGQDGGNGTVGRDSGDTVRSVLISYCHNPFSGRSSILTSVKIVCDATQIVPTIIMITMLQNQFFYLVDLRLYRFAKKEY